MPRIANRLQRIMNNPKDIKWDELKTILEYIGFICVPPSTGSHWTVYHDQSEINQTVPVHNNRVKPIYVKKLIRLIQEIQGEE